MAPGRTLHVRCTTWDQVESFHTRKLRRGKLLSMKVPFVPELGSSVTLGLELPNDLVIAIDGVVRKASPIEGDTKTWIEVELIGFTDEVVARIRAMAAGVIAVPEAPAAPPSGRARSRSRARSSPSTSASCSSTSPVSCAGCARRRFTRSSAWHVMRMPRRSASAG